MINSSLDLENSIREISEKDVDESIEGRKKFNKKVEFENEVEK